MRALTYGSARKFLTGTKDIIRLLRFIVGILKSREYLCNILSLLLSTLLNYSSIFIITPTVTETVTYVTCTRVTCPAPGKAAKGGAKEANQSELRKLKQNFMIM